MKNCPGRRLLSPRAYRGLAGAAIIVASCALRAQVVVDGAGIDFGDVSGHKVVTKTISLRSSSDRPVRITDVIKTCICADMEVSPMTIEPHGEAVVTSTLDPNVFAGPFRKTFYLRTDDPETPSLMIPVSGEVRPWWTVTPARDQTLKAAGDEARFEISCAADAPALARAAIEGEAGARVAISTNESGRVECVFTPPAGLPAGWHRWNISVFSASDEAYPLKLSVSCASGTRWLAHPRVVRFNAEKKDKTATFVIKPLHGDVPVDALGAAEISVEPAMDGVVFEKDGEATFLGQPMKVTIPGEHLSSWKTDKVFHITVPGSGSADLAVKLNRKAN